MRRIIQRILGVATILLLAVSGCRSTAMTAVEHQHKDEMPSLSPVVLSVGEKLRVVATTSIVADVVRNVGGDSIDLTTLMSPGTDPHTFEPTPQDAVAVATAHVLFINGTGLEVFLEPLLESVGEGVTVVPVSYGVELRQSEGETEHEEEGEHLHSDADPHTWFDPGNVIVWTRNIEQALSTLDPANVHVYAVNAAAYRAELEVLDAWIRQQLAQVPQTERQLVTDHAAFTYFTHRYGLEQVGAVFPGYSTLAEPSAQELAALEDAIRESGVKAVFVGQTVNPALAQRVADDTGVQLVFIYTGSLSEPGGPAADYLALMRYNVAAITDALR